MATTPYHLLHGRQIESSLKQSCRWISRQWRRVWAGVFSQLLVVNYWYWRLKL